MKHSTIAAILMITLAADTASCGNQVNQGHQDNAGHTLGHRNLHQ